MTAPSPAMSLRLVLATNNSAKLAELTRILAAAHLDVRLASLAEFPGAPEVAETGDTFAENALLKAHAIAGYTGLPAVADDSGLCVDALNGMPGVLSARWAGRHGDDEANLRLVLAQVADVPDERLGAQFVCAAALVTAGGQAGHEQVSEGVLRGRLIREARGENGFGYDPIFVPDGEQITTAEMDPDAKDRISHRGKALRGLTPAIAALLG
jgi:XTP/dITP diphosphohydrolase